MCFRFKVLPPKLRRHLRFKFQGRGRESRDARFRAKRMFTGDTERSDLRKTQRNCQWATRVSSLLIPFVVLEALGMLLTNRHHGAGLVRRFAGVRVRDRAGSARDTKQVGEARQIGEVDEGGKKSATDSTPHAPRVQ